MKKNLVILLAVGTAGLAGCASTQGRSTTVYPYNNNTSGYYSQPVYAQPQVSTQDEYNKKIIKQGLLGAATGAIAAETSGGKAGTGALVGAGTNIIGGALFDVLTTPSQPQAVQYAPYVTQWNQENPNTTRIVRKFDSYGNVISQETFTR